MRVFAASDVGKIRPINEDSYYIPQKGESFCAVADGMGGHNAGEVASALAIRVYAEYLRTASTEPETRRLESAVSAANRAVYREASLDEAKAGMGTTFTALYETKDRILVAQVGDSRAYLVRHGQIRQITQDHSLVEQMVRDGQITERQARVHPMRNYITRALGTGESVEVDLFELEKEPEDIYLLCSDGLSSFVENWQMLTVILSSRSWPQKLQDLISLALEAGGHDNITAMLISLEEEAE